VDIALYRGKTSCHNVLLLWIFSVHWNLKENQSLIPLINEVACKQDGGASARSDLIFSLLPPCLVPHGGLCPVADSRRLIPIDWETDFPVFLDGDKSGAPESRHDKSREGSAVPCVNHPDNLSSLERYCPGADRRRISLLHVGEHSKAEQLCLVRLMRRENCDNNVVRSKQALKHSRSVGLTAVENQYSASCMARENPFRLDVRNQDCVHPHFKNGIIRNPFSWNLKMTFPDP
jgi:hypothetical protein